MISYDTLKQAGYGFSDSGTVVVSFDSDRRTVREEIIWFRWACNYNGCYSIHKENVAYVIGDKMYVAPVTAGLLEELRTKNFKKKNFYVPFTDGTYPKTRKAIWDRLKKKASKANKRVVCSA